MTGEEGVSQHPLAAFRGAPGRSLLMLYAATFIMRAAAYMSIAVITSDQYLETGVSMTTIGLIIACYPLAEVASVLYFGSLCDRLGRKPVLIFAHASTGLAVLLFLTTNYTPLLLAFSALFGIGAASKVTSTLSMVSDHSSQGNKAQLMAYFDIVTLIGLAGGYAFGLLALNLWGVSPSTCFIIAAIAVFASVGLVWLWVKETSKPACEPSRQMSALDRVKTVFGDKSLQKLLPVYIPVICIYGMVITFTEQIAEEIDFTAESRLLYIIGIVAVCLTVSMIFSAWLSDRLRKRKPFIVAGLLCFGLLAGMLVSLAIAAEDGNLGEAVDKLWSMWPVLALVSLGGGAFPPAILAYLSDISHKETRGTTFGVYSLVFGTGMIIGPIAAGFAIEYYGLPGFLALIGIFIFVAVVFTAFLPEPDK